MNKYGLPLIAPSVQTILPVMTKDGRVHGFFPIAEAEFEDADITTFTTSDGAECPLSSVTVDTDPNLHAVTQYVACVYDVGLPFNMTPWASIDLIATADCGYYNWYSMPTSTWVQHFGKGSMITAIQTNMALEVGGGFAPNNPYVENPDAVQTWAASVDYKALNGDCAFFDFNWISVFTAYDSNGNDPLRITVVSNPDPGEDYPSTQLKATVIGIPVATGHGVIYNTVRITRLASELLPGDYEFVFKVIDTNDGATTATLTLTVL